MRNMGRMGGSTSSATVSDIEGLERLAERWDELAVAGGKPACSPSWMLGWCRLLSPNTEIVSVVVHEGGELVGLAPLVLDRTGGRDDVRIMGAGLLHRIGPLARPGSDRLLAAAIGANVAAIRPRPDVISLESVSVSEGWPTLIRQGLRRTAPARLHWTSYGAAPVVTLQGHSFDSWMATRSANFRSEMRRCRRRLARSGGSVRLVTGSSPDLRQIVRALGDLHRGRWVPAGHPGVIDGRVEQLILDVALAQPDGDRLRLWVVEIDGEPVSVQVFLAAGGNINYWNGGWNEAHRDLKPGMMGILAAIEDATAREERRLDLGGGAQAYKLRFADTNDPLESAVVAPLQARYPRTRLEILRLQLRYRAFPHLPATVRTGVKAVVRRHEAGRFSP